MSGTRALRVQPRSPLRAPVFWLALLTLFVNDQLLKGAGLAPGWLTGKLSDVAGLIVAPLAAAELCRGPLRGLRALAPCLVVVAFVATELFAPAARAVELGLSMLGLSWRLWPDPSDLLALAVLPLTFRLLALRASPAALAPGERLALALACAACLATSDVDPYAYSPFLVNHSGTAIELRARFHENVSCEQPLAALAADLATGPQPPEHALQLEPTQVVALDAAPVATSLAAAAACGSWREAEDLDAAGLPATPCIAVRLAGDGLPPQLMRARRQWTRDDQASRCAPTIPVYEDPGEGALVIARHDGEPRLIAHERLELLRLP